MGSQHLNLGQREFFHRLRALAEQSEPLIGRTEVTYKENARGQVVFAVIVQGQLARRPT